MYLEIPKHLTIWCRGIKTSFLLSPFLLFLFPPLCFSTATPLPRLQASCQGEDGTTYCSCCASSLLLHCLSPSMLDSRVSHMPWLRCKAQGYRPWHVANHDLGAWGRQPSHPHKGQLYAKILLHDLRWESLQSNCRQDYKKLGGLSQTKFCLLSNVCLRWAVKFTVLLVYSSLKVLNAVAQSMTSSKIATPSNRCFALFRQSKTRTYKSVSTMMCSRTPAGIR